MQIIDPVENKDFHIRDRLFHEDNMYVKMKEFALSENLKETNMALQFMRKQHDGQFRKQGKFTSVRIQYINHPLLMACQAHAFGIRDDVLLSSILLHDVVEDTGITVNELPFSSEVKEIVDLVSFSLPAGMTKDQAKAAYYERLKNNGKACVVKIIDRCNNVSTMAGSFSAKKLNEYIGETEKYIMPIFDVLKDNYPEYRDIAFLVKYHILSVIETIKCMTVS